MIGRPRIYPIDNRVLNIAHIRFNGNESKREVILNELKKRELGYIGEKQVDYHLSLIPEDKCYILNNLRIKFGTSHFEIDTVLITHHFILPIGIKNYRGKLFFDQELKQCIRTFMNVVESVTDPISLSNRHVYQLKNVWKMNKLPPLPMVPLVVIANPSTTISTNPGLEKDLHKIVIHSDFFLTRLEELYKTYPTRRYTERQMKNVGEFLLSLHEPKPPHVLQKLNLTPKDFHIGVQCPSCLCFHMIWRSGKWHCPHCHASSKIAHEAALHDYFLLYNKSTITNNECLKFLKVDSANVIKRLLGKVDFLTKEGQTSDTRYRLKDDVFLK